METSESDPRVVVDMIEEGDPNPNLETTFTETDPSHFLVMKENHLEVKMIAILTEEKDSETEEIAADPKADMREEKDMAEEDTVSVTEEKAMELERDIMVLTR